MAWDFPLIGNYTETQDFHQGHPGVDLAEAAGSPILATAAGVVTRIGMDGYGPYYIEIDHGNGVVSYYGHGSMANVKVGDHVAAGQQIGLVGSLGNSTGPHLHFGIKINGVISDPIAYLNKQGVAHLTTPGLSGLLNGTTAPNTSGLSHGGLASALGLSEALFDSVPELKHVMEEAERNDWEPTTAQGQANFTAALQNTKWYKSHSDAARKWELLVRADPGEANHQRSAMLANVAHAAASMGVTLSKNDEFVLAARALQSGLSDDELKFSIASHLKISKTGTYGGDAGKLADALREHAQNFGMPSSAQDIGRNVYDIMNGRSSEQDYLNKAKSYAKGLFPGISAAIDAGQTVREAASPYLQVYQQVLEQDSNTVDLTRDKLLRQALAYKPATTDKAGQGQDVPPSTMPLWQFEQAAKNDSRWLSTDNATQSIVGAGQRVLKDMGLSV